MAQGLYVEIEGLERFELMLRRFESPLLQQNLEKAAWLITARIVAMAAVLAPKDTGILAGSLHQDVWGDGLNVFAQVSSGEVYAIVMELGRRPGRAAPPEGALLGWMRRHGIDERMEYPLRMSIARRGIVPQPFLRPALWANRGYAIETVAKALTGGNVAGAPPQI